MSKKWSTITQTATELCSIVSNGKLHSVSVQTAEGYVMSVWKDRCKRMDCIYIPGGKVITLIGNAAARAVKPYRKRVQCAMRERRRAKRRAEQERRGRLKGIIS